jgi:hypothetical protein
MYTAPLLYAVTDGGVVRITGPLASTWCGPGESAVDDAELRLLHAHLAHAPDARLNVRSSTLHSAQGFEVERLPDGVVRRRGAGADR